MSKRYLWVVERWSVARGWNPTSCVAFARSAAREEAEGLRVASGQIFAKKRFKFRVVRYSAEDK